MGKFSKAVDEAIAAENRQFLNDPAAMQAARDDGDRIRRQLVMEGMTFLAIAGDPLPNGTVKS